MECKGLYNYDEIQSFIKKQVEGHFKLQVVTPVKVEFINDATVENPFKLMVITPYRGFESPSRRVEEHFKNK